MSLFKISLWWHMLLRGHVQETTLALNSLQGLYDGIVIAVDDRPDSDEVFEFLRHYPNMNAYRQNFDDFGRFHTNYTILKKEIRNNYLTISNEMLIEIDVKNSQPLFFAVLPQTPWPCPGPSKVRTSPRPWQGYFSEETKDRSRYDQ